MIRPRQCTQFMPKKTVYNGQCSGWIVQAIVRTPWDCPIPFFAVRALTAFVINLHAASSCGSLDDIMVSLLDHTSRSMSNIV